MALLPQTYVSLFSGIGGLDLAIKIAVPTCRCVLYVENEATAAQRLVARIQDGFIDDAPIWSDVSTLKGNVLKGHADMVVGGFPCTDISDAWRTVLAVRPDLAPAIESPIRRVVAGASGGMVSARQDELRGLGNLVVPIQGAFAFLVLWHRMFGEMP